MGLFAIGLMAAISCVLNIVVAIDDSKKNKGWRIAVDIIFAAASAVAAIIAWIHLGFTN